MLQFALNALRMYATKNKTNKSAHSRFFKLSTGEYAYQSAGRNHNFCKKSTGYRHRHRQTLSTSPNQTRRLNSIYA